jgi:protein TonB
MPRVKHYPTARLPRADRRYGSGVILAAVVHVLAIGLLLVSWTHRYQLSQGEGDGPAGGGGGGGGGRSIQYVQLPPRSAYGSQRPRPAPSEPKQEITLPTPKIEQTEEPVVVPQTTPEPVELALPTIDRSSTSSTLALGPGTGTGLGPGSGSGSGGGIGSGRGTGVGSGVGPGTGGEGVAVYAPEPRAVIYPFEEPPAAMRGQQYSIRFWVDARGKITKIEIEPEIQDKKFRDKLLERVWSWVFYPARTAEGKPVNGQFVITYAP